MSLPLSRELDAVLDEADDIADRVDQPLSSAHLLLALFTVPNRAAAFLDDRDITVDQLLDRLEDTCGEAPATLDRIHQRAARIASGSRADTQSSLHLLAALVRESRGQAVALLEQAGIKVSAIRASVMGYATGSTPLPRRFRTLDPQCQSPSPRQAPTRHDKHREEAPSSIGFHPSLGIADTSRRRQAIEQNVVETTQPPERPSREPGSANHPDGRSCPPASSTTSPSPSPDNQQSSSPSSPADEAMTDANRTARDLAARLFGGSEASDHTKQRAETSPPGVERRSDQPASADRSDPEAPEDTCESGETDGGLPDVPGAELTAIAQESSALDDVCLDGPLDTDPDLASSYELDEDDYPNLVEFGRNLTAQAARGDIDRVVGREREILQLIDILGKRRSNNPVLVGEAGVGKTACVEGLSREFVKLAHADNPLGQRAIIELELGRLLSGTHLRGSFSERLIGIKDEVDHAGGDVIVFLDELHAWMSTGSGGDGADAAGELKTALARGQFPCIGATTRDEFRQFIESDAAFERRFGMVRVDEPDVDTAELIAQGVRGHYEQHHDVAYTDQALQAAVRLSHRYIYQRRLPDKAISVLDLAGSRAARTGHEAVDRPLVAEVVAEMAGIPVDRLTQSDRQRFLDMESHLEDGIIGHRHVVQSISEVIRRNYAGFRGQRPIGSLLFLGPTGVGKTEMVKVLADFLFHDRDAVVRLDMSEFMEAHSVSRMVGAPPGYVGHDQGGQLTEAIRQRPYQIVLFDEVEKAHPDVLNLLLQLFDEGQLTDGRGRVVDCSNTVIVMTSNLGAEVFDQMTRPDSGSRIGFGHQPSPDHNGRTDTTDAVLDDARQHFTPELWNRIDEKLVFLPLTRQQIAGIAQLQLDDSRERLHDESGISLEFDPAVVDHLIDNGGFDPELGARPMRQTIQRLVEGEVARLILSGRVSRGDTMRVEIHDRDVVCVPVT